MDKHALEMAQVEFDRAFQSMTNLGAAQHFAEIERHWSAFLVSAGRVYTKLEQGSKSDSKCAAWWGRKLRERRTEPLLAYIWHARNADEHGLRKVTQKHPGSFNFVPPSGGRDYGEIQVIYPHIQLVNVIDKGVCFPVPHILRGQQIHHPHPNNIGLLALRELEALIGEASSFLPPGLPPDGPE
jgi:hypothetical protein